jgi:hypothetical protein
LEKANVISQGEIEPKPSFRHHQHPTALIVPYPEGLAARRIEGSIASGKGSRDVAFFAKKQIDTSFHHLARTAATSHQGYQGKACGCAVTGLCLEDRSENKGGQLAIHDCGLLCLVSHH